MFRSWTTRAHTWRPENDERYYINAITAREDQAAKDYLHHARKLERRIERQNNRIERQNKRNMREWGRRRDIRLRREIAELATDGAGYGRYYQRGMRSPYVGYGGLVGGYGYGLGGYPEYSSSYGLYGGTKPLGYRGYSRRPSLLRQPSSAALVPTAYPVRPGLMSRRSSYGYGLAGYADRPAYTRGLSYSSRPGLARGLSYTRPRLGRAGSYGYPIRRSSALVRHSGIVTPMYNARRAILPAPYVPTTMSNALIRRGSLGGANARLGANLEALEFRNELREDAEELAFARERLDGARRARRIAEAGEMRDRQFRAVEREQLRNDLVQTRMERQRVAQERSILGGLLSSSPPRARAAIMPPPGRVRTPVPTTRMIAATPWNDNDSVIGELADSLRATRLRERVVV